MELQTNVMNYGGTGTTISVPAPEKKAACACHANGSKPATNGACACAAPKKEAAPKSKATNGEPDFRSMTTAEKVAFHKARWDRILG